MDRIKNHPILGETPKRKKVTFSYDGKLLEGYEGEPIATALKAAGVMAHRYTAKTDRKSTRLNSSHIEETRMPSSA